MTELPSFDKQEELVLGCGPVIRQLRKATWTLGGLQRCQAPPALPRPHSGCWFQGLSLISLCSQFPEEEGAVICCSQKERV